MCRDTAVSVVSVLHANSVHLGNKQGNMKIVCLVVEPPYDAVVPVCNCDIDRSNSLLSGQIKVDVIQAEPEATAKRTSSQDNVLFKHSFNSAKVTFPACKWH